MSYQIRRIDPFWIRHPAVLALIAAGLLLVLGGLAPLMMGGSAAAAAGLGKGKLFVVIAGFCCVGVGVFLLTKPVVSLVVGSLGLLGGMLTFVILPNAQTGDLSFFFKLFAAIVFGVLYMVLMDFVVVVATKLYNLFSSLLGGIELDFDEVPSQEGE